MILALWAFEQMEGNEARHLVEMRFTRHPHLLEIVLGSLPHLESIHGNEHHHSPEEHVPQVHQLG